VFCFIWSWNNLWRDFLSEEIAFKGASEKAGRHATHSGLENWNPTLFYCSPFLLWWCTITSLSVKPLTPVKIMWEDSTPVRWHLAFSEDSVVDIDIHIMRAISQENVMTCVLHGFKSGFQRELPAIISMFFHTVLIPLLHTSQGTLKLRFTLRTWKFLEIEIHLRI
jgi:hypothetical protein